MFKAFIAYSLFNSFSIPLKNSFLKNLKIPLDMKVYFCYTMLVSYFG